MLKGGVDNGSIYVYTLMWVHEKAQLQMKVILAQLQLDRDVELIETLLHRQGS